MNSKINTSTTNLSEDEIRKNFTDMHPPLTASQALIEADRCYFCYDAPCITACPTGIDIPGFIQKIRSDNIKGSAHTILSENILGGMCARVCPTEVLCERECVRNSHEDKPVAIGLLQRFATDPIINANTQLFERAPISGKRVAIVGSGPAGLSCAHRLAMLGHHVVMFETREQSGGLNEYGIAAYKTADNFAQREVNYVTDIGGIERRRIHSGTKFDLETVRIEYDAVFLGIGLGAVNTLGLEQESIDGVLDAVEYIEQLRQVTQYKELPVGRDIIVIGGGMTAIDVAVQSKKLGAENVTIVYRRGPDQMNASAYEQSFAKDNGVVIRHWLSPAKIISSNNCVAGMEFLRTTVDENGNMTNNGEVIELTADVIFKAIGQKMRWESLGDAADPIKQKNNRIYVDEHRKTSLPDVWAGGDCVCGGENLTVSAVQDGKLAAISIDQYLR